MLRDIWDGLTIICWHTTDLMFSTKSCSSKRRNFFWSLEQQMVCHSTTLLFNIFLSVDSIADNVHSQHSMLLMSKLNEIGMFYETQIYPDSGHSLSEATIHLYERMENFVDRCFFY